MFVQIIFFFMEINSQLTRNSSEMIVWVKKQRTNKMLHKMFSMLIDKTVRKNILATRCKNHHR